MHRTVEGGRFPDVMLYDDENVPELGLERFSHSRALQALNCTEISMKLVFFFIRLVVFVDDLRGEEEDNTLYDHL